MKTKVPGGRMNTNEKIIEIQEQLKWISEWISEICTEHLYAPRICVGICLSKYAAYLNYFNS